MARIKNIEHWSTKLNGTRYHNRMIRKENRAREKKKIKN